MKTKTAVLVSGGGTNLQALIDYQIEKGSDCPYEIVIVISDHKDAYALERAAKAGIPTTIRSPYSVMGKEVAQASDRDTKRTAVSNAVLEDCKSCGAQVIVQAGWLTVLAGEVLNVYEGKIIARGYNRRNTDKNIKNLITYILNYYLYIFYSSN